MSVRGGLCGVPRREEPGSKSAAGWRGEDTSARSRLPVCTPPSWLEGCGSCLMMDRSSLPSLIQLDQTIMHPPASRHARHTTHLPPVFEDGQYQAATFFLSLPATLDPAALAIP